MKPSFLRDSKALLKGLQGLVELSAASLRVAEHDEGRHPLIAVTDGVGGIEGGPAVVDGFLDPLRLTEGDAQTGEGNGLPSHVLRAAGCL